jgi:DNA-binding PadR family transcriptional regulator
MLDLTLLQLKVLWTIHNKDSCGYELMKKLSGKKKKLTQGTLYPLLQSLEKAGMIAPSASGVRGKKYYSMTSKGKRTLDLCCREFCNLYHDIFREFVCEECRR